MKSITDYCVNVVDDFFCYETPKVVTFKSYYLGVMYRCIQLGIILYISVFVMYFQQNYQTNEDGYASVMTKIKGSNIVHRITMDSGEEKISYKEDNMKVIDALTHQTSMMDEKSFVIPTRYLETSNQKSGKCLDESQPCTRNDECLNNLFAEYGQNSGICRSDEAKNSTDSTKQKFCEVASWCPLENLKTSKTYSIDISDAAYLGNYTIFMKISVFFKKFGISIQNLPKQFSRNTFKYCRYDKNDTLFKYCPIFFLRDMVPGFEKNIDQIVKKGTIIVVFVDWNCDFDHDVNDCMPEYKFLRVDEDGKRSSTGYNMRYAKYDMFRKGNFDEETRTTYKIYGIKFDVLVRATGRKFDIVSTLLNVGSGLALLGLSSFLCDVIIFKVLPAKDLYKNATVEYYDVQTVDQDFNVYVGSQGDRKN